MLRTKNWEFQDSPVQLQHETKQGKVEPTGVLRQILITFIESPSLSTPEANPWDFQIYAAIHFFYHLH